MTSIRTVLAQYVLPFALWAAATASLIAVRGRLPDPVAVHYGPDGIADGFVSVQAFVWWGAVGLLVFALLAAALPLFGGRQVVGGRVLAGSPAGLTSFATALLLGLASAQLDLDDAAGHRISPAFLIVPLGLGVLGWVLGAWLAGRPPAAPPAEPAARPAAGLPREPLAEGQTAVWRGTAARGAIPLIIAGSVLAVTAVLAVMLEPWFLFIPLVVGLGLVSMTSFRVTAGRSGLVVAGSPLGLPRFHVPLDRIASARAVDTRSLAWGGWGLRVMPNRTGIITRSGPAVAIERTDGAQLVVTVDDPDAVAGVINSLLDRMSAE